jgi:hypothetical protein
MFYKNEKRGFTGRAGDIVNVNCTSKGRWILEDQGDGG